MMKHRHDIAENLKPKLSLGKVLDFRLCHGSASGSWNVIEV